MKILEKILGNFSEKEIKKCSPILNKIIGYETKFAAMSDDELREMTHEFTMRYINHEPLDDILPEAFAVVREADERVLGMYPYPVQVLGGIILHKGMIAEMKTGEGKTLVETMPAYLNAITGMGVHIVTTNDYLAQRDRKWMGAVFEFLGLSVGLITHDMKPEDRKKAYSCDITYGTNSEFGFDYLRDNMAVRKEDCVQRGFSYAIIDEADSILIDEARTPLIISGTDSASDEMYERADRFAKTLSVLRVKEQDKKEATDDIDADYIVDQKHKTAVLTPRGVSKAEKYFGVENLNDYENINLLHHILLAIKANGVMRNETDYMIKDGRVIIIDEFTGRLMNGRQYNDGLHQAIEAKEGLMVSGETKTRASITFQNFYRMYGKLSGMTGTAMTEADEFREIYGLMVATVPTNKPVIRKDMPDVIYKTEKAKLEAVCEDIRKAHEKGQPVLVGTVSVEKSEKLGAMLDKMGIAHEVLNAKNHEREAHIIESAGKPFAVTIATNMAGRGTDIKLMDNAAALGGLFVIGTERHESRRVDNQLRGRSGRQGDPGMSRFYISLEDDLMKLFGGDRIQSLMDDMDIPEDEPIGAKFLSGAVEHAQKRIEARNFDIRKNLIRYDDVISTQRDIIYSERRKVLDGRDISGEVKDMVSSLTENCMESFMPDGGSPDAEGLCRYINRILECNGMEDVSPELFSGAGRKECRNITEGYLYTVYLEREKAIPEGVMREMERMALLKNIDSKWMEHIDMMEDLRGEIGLCSYAGRDPVTEYRIEGSLMFEELMKSIRENTARDVLTAKVHMKILN